MSCARLPYSISNADINASCQSRLQVVCTDSFVHLQTCASPIWNTVYHEVHMDMQPPAKTPTAYNNKPL